MELNFLVINTILTDEYYENIHALVVLPYFKITLTKISKISLQNAQIFKLTHAFMKIKAKFSRIEVNTEICGQT